VPIVHHLDCCTMCPMGGRALWGDPPKLVGHVLAIETDRDGLVLVDTGVGLDDRAATVRRLGPIAALGGFPKEPAGSAVRQIEALGFQAADVRHIVLTHFDLDHAGGVADFPGATVHLLREEMEAACHPPTFAERQRYKRWHVSAVSRWEAYEGTGEAWHGFAAAQRLRGLHDDLLLVPLVGHSRGHAGVAVPEGPVHALHCGDAYFGRHVVQGRPGPPGPALFEKLAAWDRRKALGNHARLATAMADPTLRVFCAHDPSEMPG